MNCIVFQKDINRYTMLLYKLFGIPTRLSDRYGISYYYLSCTPAVYICTFQNIVNVQKGQKLILFDKLYNIITFSYLIKTSNISLNIREALQILPSIRKQTFSYTKDLHINYLHKNSYLHNVRKIINDIRIGDYFQIQFSKKIIVKNIKGFFKILCMFYRSSFGRYVLFYNGASQSLLTCSPETLMHRSRMSIKVKPIAGTARRGYDILIDKLYERKLLRNRKEHNEHDMLIDMYRNDITKSYNTSISYRYYSIKTIEKYSTVQHLVSTILFRIPNHLSLFDDINHIAYLNPAGTLCGAPRSIVLPKIKKSFPIRQYYGGIFGISIVSGSDFGIIIRCLERTFRTISLQSASGIVKDSIPQYEWNELSNKIRNVSYNLKI
ncbi:chorismate-binding protein [Candidatus Vidania fulgoroideorum]